jgi:hypothetical protein
MFTVADIQQRDGSLQSGPTTRGRQEEDWRATGERDAPATGAVKPTLER